MYRLLIGLLYGCSALLAAVAPPKEIIYSPFNVVEIATADSIAVKAINAPNLNVEYMRYITLHNYPEAARPITKAVLNKVLNSLGPKHRKIVRAVSLPINADKAPVVRINLMDYGISPKAWDILVEKGSGAVPLPEPYFHENIETNDHLPTIEQISELSPTYKGVAVKHDKGTQGLLTVTVPVDAKIYIDTTIQTKTGTKREFSFDIKDGQSKSLAVKVTIKLNGQDASITRQVTVWSGWDSQIEIGSEKHVTQIVNPPIKVKKEKLYAAASWIAIERVKEQRGRTVAALMTNVQTKHPIVRADWFITYATWAPAYYHLIGLELKDNPDKEKAKATPKVFLEKDFEALFKFKFVTAKEDITAAVTDTKIVALHKRLLQRFSTVMGITGGYYWRSQDTDKGLDAEDYLVQLPTFDAPKKKAQEIIASGRNGLNFYALTDDKGVLLDLAAANIAQHSSTAMPTKLQDKQVYNARNCMLCHSTGMLKIKDNVRTLAQGKIAAFINDKNYDQQLARKIEEAFTPDPESIIGLDNAKYNAAVFAASGREGRIIGKAFEEIICDYLQEPITIDVMAREAGIDAALLKHMLGRGINIDPLLTAVLQDPPVATYRQDWENRGYGALMRYIISYNPR